MALPDQASWNDDYNKYPGRISTGPPPNVDPGTGTWYYVQCPNENYTGIVWYPNNPGPGVGTPPTNPLTLVQQALAKMHLGAPSIAMSPSTNAEVVNFQDWLWIDRGIWQTMTATASAGLVSATATATPDRVVWNMGDGHQVTCMSAGTPYDRNIAPDHQQTDCSYVYPNSSAGQPGNKYTVTATVYWHVTWTATGAPGGGDLGDIGGAPSTTPVQVDEIQAINDPPR